MDRPALLSAGGGAFWRAKRTWKSGVLSSERPGARASTSFSKGTSWWAWAPIVSSRTRESSSRKEGLPSSRARNARVLTKKPMSPSISAKRRPAMGEPTMKPSWPQ